MAVMGLSAFTSEEKIGKKLNSSKMATNGTGGPLYNRTYLQKVTGFPENLVACHLIHGDIFHFMC